MAWPSIKEQIFIRIENLMKGITVANGFPLTVNYVDRQYKLFTDSVDPAFFPRIIIRDGFEDLTFKTNNIVRSTLTYSLVASLVLLNAQGLLDKDAQTLQTDTNKFIAAIVDSIASDSLLIGSISNPSGGPCLVTDHKIERVTTDEGFLAPQSVFVVRNSLIYTFKAGQA